MSARLRLRRRPVFREFAARLDVTDLLPWSLRGIQRSLDAPLARPCDAVTQKTDKQ
ncbi:hypothetical protein ACH5AO_08100 [Streptomyces sp. NPDC018964]|uniref:hypothetical protein n=1 Tax=unclassified Streptomyces TaxID=2593676 RepID=UPI0037887138